MVSYLACIKRLRGTNDPECRTLAKSYLSCRMDRYVVLYVTPLSDVCIKAKDIVHNRNLMAKDEFKNLGFAEDTPKESNKTSEGGGKNELRW